MSYTQKITALNKGLTPIFPEQDRINFAPKLAGDIRVLLPTSDGSTKYLTLNHVYSEDDSSNSEVYTSELNGTVWAVSDIDGWWNLSEPEMPDIQRGFGDGSFDITGRNQARNLTLTGSILITESSRENIATLHTAARTALISAFNLVKRGTWLIVDEDGYKRAAFVRLSGRPDIVTTNSKGRIDFSIGLKAADPTKYEWYPTSSEGQIPSGFTGDGNAYRIAETTGGSTNYRTYPSTGTISGVRAHTGTVSATYATNQIILTINGGGISLIGYNSANHQYIYVSGLTYTNATNGTSGPFEIVSGTTVGGTTIKYTAPTGTTGVSGTPLVTLQQQTSLYRGYPTSGNIGIGQANSHGAEVTTYYRNYPNISFSNSSSGTLSVINYGETNVPCYIRFVGPLYGSAFITNSTTGQTINILAPTTTGGQVLYPNETISTVQFLGIDTHTHEVHIGDYYNGITTTNVRGLLAPLVDWIYLAPGVNDFFYEDKGAEDTAGSIEIYWRSGWDG